MIVRPCTLKTANELVASIHRHHKPVVGHRFSLALWDGDRLEAVAICGRPVARKCDQELTLEILRCASHGAPNAISKIYGAICRAAKAMGFKRVQTYTLPEEGGASLKASGFVFEGTAGGGAWTNREGRRTDQPTVVKWRWARIFEED